MELLRYFIAICLFFYTEAERLRQPGYEFDEVAKVWFRLHRLKATWHKARRMCEMEGAILASPLNKPMKDAFDSYTRTHKIDEIFVGVHSTFGTGLWYTIEGVSVEDLIYVDLNQLNEAEHRCSMLTNGSLISANCLGMYPYICYRRTNEQLTPCGTTDKGKVISSIEYKLQERTGHCYKFHEHEETWWNAVRICSSEQAYLAIINSDTEAEIIKNIFGNSDKDSVSVGVTDWERDGNWYTIHGERLENSGFSKWNTEVPNNKYYSEYCVSLNQNGLFSDVPCFDKFAFICEKDSVDALMLNAVIFDEYYR